MTAVSDKLADADARAASALVEVRTITKTYQARRRQVTALSELSLRIGEGEFVAVVGRSGCGKSTLLRLLSGLESQTDGEILVDGEPLDGPPPQARCVFQDYGQSLMPWKTVTANVRFGLRHAHRPTPGPAADTAERLLRAVGLLDVGDRYPWELSGGMQQRVAIARALAARPRVLYMDEAFSAVDALSRATLQDVVLNAWADADLTVVFVTHDIDEAVYLADRVVVLRPDGQGVLADIPVDVPRPRRQIETRESAEFLRHRRQLLQLVLD